MQMLYHSDQYVVVRFELAATGSVPEGLTDGGFEIVDKAARREVFLVGALAEQFRQGVQAIADTAPTPENFDAFIARYADWAQQPVTLH